MRPNHLLALLCLATGSAAAQTPGPRVVPLDSLTWRPGGPGLEIAIADGDPSVAGREFTMVLRLADGAWIPPHTHNIAKRLLVLEGRLLLGHGARIDPAAVREMGVGDFAVVPADHAHFEGGRGRTVVALYGVGPLRTTMLPQP